jgi:hypothetical protein
MHVDQQKKHINYIFHHISFSRSMSDISAVDFCDCLGKERALSLLIELSFLE